jgi:hypothetical protein
LTKEAPKNPQGAEARIQAEARSTSTCCSSGMAKTQELLSKPKLLPKGTRLTSIFNKPKTPDSTCCFLGVLSKTKNFREEISTFSKIFLSKGKA